MGGMGLGTRNLSHSSTRTMQCLGTWLERVSEWHKEVGFVFVVKVTRSSWLNLPLNHCIGRKSNDQCNCQQLRGHTWNGSLIRGSAEQESKKESQVATDAAAAQLASWGRIKWRRRLRGGAMQTVVLIIDFWNSIPRTYSSEWGY